MKFKGTITFLCVLVLACNMIPVSAGNINYNEGVSGEIAVACPSDDCLKTNTDDSSQYFRFDSKIERMDAGGNFTFSFTNVLDSGVFKPSSSSITVISKATNSIKSQPYYIYLYKADGTYVNMASYMADGSSYQYTFTGLSTSTSYYLEFYKPVTGSGKFTGSGKINYIQ